MKLSESQCRVLADVSRRTKNLPVGVPVDNRVGPSLRRLGLIEPAPPAWNYPVPRATYRMTVLGRAALLVYRRSG